MDDPNNNRRHDKLSCLIKSNTQEVNIELKNNDNLTQNQRSHFIEQQPYETLNPIALLGGLELEESKVLDLPKIELLDKLDVGLKLFDPPEIDKGRLVELEIIPVSNDCYSFECPSLICQIALPSQKLVKCGIAALDTTDCINRIETKQQNDAFYNEIIKPSVIRCEDETQFVDCPVLVGNNSPNSPEDSATEREKDIPLEWAQSNFIEKYKINVIITNDKGTTIIEDLSKSVLEFEGKPRFRKALQIGKQSSEPVEELIRSEEPSIISANISDREVDELITPALRDITNVGTKVIIFQGSISEESVSKLRNLPYVNTNVFYLSDNSEVVYKSVCKILGLSRATYLIIDSNPKLVWESLCKQKERIIRQCDSLLPHVKYYPSSESHMHWLMKRVCFNHIIRKGYSKEQIYVEEPIENSVLGLKIRPDLRTYDGGLWECETGYPCKEEECILRDLDPFSRLVWKLEKFNKDCFQKTSINFVFSSEYYFLFPKSIYQLKRYAKEVMNINLKLWTVNWSKKKLEQVGGFENESKN